MAATLDRATGRGPVPALIPVDLGIAFTSRALQTWAYRRGAQPDSTPPRKPTENSYIESLIGKLRDECLNVHQFADRTDAQARIEAWRHDYSEQRSHGALGHLTPRQFARQRQEPGTAEPAQLSA